MISILYFIFVDNGLTDPKNYIWYSSYLHLIRSDSLSEIHLCYKKGKKISKLWNYELTCLTTYILIVCRMVLITGFYQILDSAFQICGNLTVSLTQEKERFILLWFFFNFHKLDDESFLIWGNKHGSLLILGFFTHVEFFWNSENIMRFSSTDEISNNCWEIFIKYCGLLIFNKIKNILVTIHLMKLSWISIL